MKKVNKNPEVLKKYGWTSVEENLPLLMENVLVLSSNGEIVVGYYVINFKNEKIFWLKSNGDLISNKCVGWRRLPQVPFK